MKYGETQVANYWAEHNEGNYLGSVPNTLWNKRKGQAAKPGNELNDDKHQYDAPPHIHHREDETFQILEGDYEFTVGGQTILAKPGTTLFAPRGVAHTYRYLGQTPGKLMCTITPSGFEGFFEEIGAMSPQEQQDIPRVMGIAKKYGLEILPPEGA